MIVWYGFLAFIDTVVMITHINDFIKSDSIINKFYHLALSSLYFIGAIFLIKIM